VVFGVVGGAGRGLTMMTMTAGGRLLASTLLFRCLLLED
jgi:hypothetical protein